MQKLRRVNWSVAERFMPDKTTVDSMDPSLQNSPLSNVDDNDDESTVMLNNAANQRYWNDQSFAEGDAVECAGTVFECNYGRWVKTD
ncbi:MAG: hypothetical protein ACI8W7_005069 [Gammaproteobacteria bacterium]